MITIKENASISRLVSKCDRLDFLNSPVFKNRHNDIIDYMKHRSLGRENP